MTNKKRFYDGERFYLDHNQVFYEAALPCVSRVDFPGDSTSYYCTVEETTEDHVVLSGWYLEHPVSKKLFFDKITFVKDVYLNMKPKRKEAGND